MVQNIRHSQIDRACPAFNGGSKGKQSGGSLKAVVFGCNLSHRHRVAPRKCPGQGWRGGLAVLISMAINHPSVIPVPFVPSRSPVKKSGKNLLDFYTRSYTFAA